ncbi:MAG TPA: hypothetical protein ENK67_02465 [Flavobacteriia bacterium]|nr:hypothetical protein [Flavobacteriia bacterium]
MKKLFSFVLLTGMLTLMSFGVTESKKPKTIKKVESIDLKVDGNCKEFADFWSGGDYSAWFGLFSYCVSQNGLPSDAL